MLPQDLTTSNNNITDNGLIKAQHRLEINQSINENECVSQLVEETHLEKL